MAEDGLTGLLIHAVCFFQAATIRVGEYVRGASFIECIQRVQSKGAANTALSPGAANTEAAKITCFGKRNRGSVT
jgi:hypothetical protein